MVAGTATRIPKIQQLLARLNLDASRKLPSRAPPFPSMP